MAFIHQYFGQCNDKNNKTNNNNNHKNDFSTTITTVKTTKTAVAVHPQHHHHHYHKNQTISLMIMSKLHSFRTNFLIISCILLLFFIIELNCHEIKSTKELIGNYQDDHIHHNDHHQQDHQHHHCNHKHPKAHEVIHGVHLAPHHVIKKRSINQPLRILLFYDDSMYRLDNDKLDIINNTILPEAVQFWERALMVRETKEIIRLNRKCESSQVFVKNSLTHCIDACKAITMCGEVQVPEEHLDVCRTCNATGQHCKEDLQSPMSAGIEHADFVFYVSARQTERCHKGLTVAYAAHCQQESALDRPIAGHANLCPDSISTRPQELQTLLSTVKHEIAHALGFSVSLYAFFRDENGNPRTPRKPDTGKPYLDEKLQIHKWSNNTIRKIVREQWAIKGGNTRRVVDMMVTPRVVEEARKHFDCPDLEGAELEDQGGEGTALTHWEKRILENEAMTGTHTQISVFSRITLALMEDSGWYRANYSMAAPLSWGKGLGCNFVLRSCKDWIYLYSAKGRSIHPFCSKVKRDPLEIECTDDRNSVALCNLIRHTKPLPKLYQHFDRITHVPTGEEEYYGGSVELADHCPYIQEFIWKNNTVAIRGSQCQFEDNNPKPEKNYALESYGKNSKCFTHSEKMWQERSCRHTREWRHWGSGCYKYQCDHGKLIILVANYSYMCHFPGQELSISIMYGGWLHRGAIICPSCREICGQYFESISSECKIREEAPPSNLYPHDELNCLGCNWRINSILLVITYSLSIIFGLR